MVAVGGFGPVVACIPQMTMVDDNVDEGRSTADSRPVMRGRGTVMD
ncbi:MAG: hypothetical protein OXC98_14350 [bacterium]|nr:hypothetical protein [bacterium]